MEAIEHIMSAEALGALIDIPPAWKSVRVIVLPVETLEIPDGKETEQKQKTTADRIAEFRRNTLLKCSGTMYGTSLPKALSLLGRGKISLRELDRGG
ncbi:hypothetical protein PilKf_01881 [Pillotina sp. SPG140]|jgi:hypothetical protein